MNSLPERIMEYAEAKPEATPIQAKDLLHLGDRAAVNRSLSRLARTERLMRICRGLYMRPIQTRFGLRAPRRAKALAALSEFWGETIVTNGGSAANCLGLTTQNVVRPIYFTSGPDRQLHFGRRRVSLRHTPRWQLTAPDRTAGIVIRALAWLGPNEVEDGLDFVLPRLAREDLDDLAAAKSALPSWMAEPLAARLANG